MARGSSSLRIVVSVVVLLALIGARVWSRSSRSPSYNSSSGVMTFAKDDAAMSAAISKSRQTAPQFIEHLASPGAGETDFSIKVPVTQGNQTEHFWLNKVTYDGSSFHGVIDNDPEIVTNIKLGQEWTCAPAQISDWIYTKDGILVGGESIRLMRDKMSPADRAAFDATAPFKFK